MVVFLLRLQDVESTNLAPARKTLSRLFWSTPGSIALVCVALEPDKSEHPVTVLRAAND